MAWGIAWATKFYAWVGLFAGAFHRAWALPSRSTDFTHLPVEITRGWTVAAIFCLVIVWGAIVLQRAVKGD